MASLMTILAAMFSLAIFGFGAFVVLGTLRMTIKGIAQSLIEARESASLNGKTQGA